MGSVARRMVRGVRMKGLRDVVSGVLRLSELSDRGGLDLVRVDWWSVGSLELACRVACCLVGDGKFTV